MRLNRKVLAAAVAVVVLAGCGKKEDAAVAGAPGESTQASADAQTAPDAESQPVVEPSSETAAPFDITSVPVSDASLGGWPHVVAPDGYALERERTLDLSQVPFWTGQALQLVEGKVYEARVAASGEKTYSRFEVLKRLDEALVAQGAVKIASGKIPRDMLDRDLPENFGVDFNVGAGGYYPGQELSTYVLRQADRVVWFKVHSGNSDGSLLVAEAEMAQ